MSDPRLVARVKAVNLANTEAKKLYNLLAPIFAPLVGQQVIKKEGGLMAKVAKLLPELPCTPKLHIYRHASGYSLAYTVKTSETVNGGAYYAETTVYLGVLDNDVLKEMSPCPDWKTDYTPEEVESRRDIYKQAKRIADNAFSALHPFGEIDR